MGKHNTSICQLKPPSLTINRKPNTANIPKIINNFIFEGDRVGESGSKIIITNEISEAIPKPPPISIASR